MKKFIVLLTAIAALLFYVFVPGKTHQPFSFLDSTTQTQVPEKISLPKTLTIPKLKLQTDVEYVGKDTTGAMDVPKSYDNVGWYKLGTIPGAIGNAVIAGHYDSETGPAIFARLSSLQQGDEIIIHDEDGTKKVFTVTDKQVYEDRNFPIRTVFGETDKRRLNLITCEGVFDPASKNYSHRTVIFSDLKE